MVINYRGTTEALSGFKPEEEEQPSHWNTCQSDLKNIKSLEKNVKEKAVGDRQVSVK